MGVGQREVSGEGTVTPLAVIANVRPSRSAETWRLRAPKPEKKLLEVRQVGGLRRVAGLELSLAQKVVVFGGLRILDSDIERLEVLGVLGLEGHGHLQGQVGRNRAPPDGREGKDEFRAPRRHTRGQVDRIPQPGKDRKPHEYRDGMAMAMQAIRRRLRPAIVTPSTSSTRK